MAKTRRLVIVMFSGVRSAHYSSLIAYRYSAFLRPFSTYADERYLLLTFDVYLPRLVSAFFFHSFSTNKMPVVFGVLPGVSTSADPSDSADIDFLPFCFFLSSVSHTVLHFCSTSLNVQLSLANQRFRNSITPSSPDANGIASGHFRIMVLNG